MTNYRTFIVLNIKLPSIYFYNVNISPDYYYNSQLTSARTGSQLTKSAVKSGWTSQCSLEEKKTLITGVEGGGVRAEGRTAMGWIGFMVN